MPRKKKKVNYRIGLAKKNASRYNKVQSIISSYRKQSKADFKGEKFHKVASAIYKQTKDVPLNQIENNIDVLVTQYFTPPVESPKITDVPISDYWNIERTVSFLASSIPIVIDNSIAENVDNYEGSIKDFDSVARAIISQLNRYVKSFPKEERNSGSFIYVPTIEGDGVVFTLTLNGADIDKRIVETEEVITKPTVGTPKQREKPEQDREIEKLKLENENIKLKQENLKLEIEKLKLEIELEKLRAKKKVVKRKKKKK